MATPTGQISLYDVRTELGRGGQISMGDGDVRQLAGRPSGQIAMSDLRGKSLNISFPEQSWYWSRPTLVYDRPLDWEGQFSQGDTVLRFSMRAKGKKNSLSTSVSLSCRVMSGRIPKQIIMYLVIRTSANEVTTNRTITYDGNTTLNDPRIFYQDVYLKSRFYLRADLIY